MEYVGAANFNYERDKTNFHARLFQQSHSVIKEMNMLYGGKRLREVIIFNVFCCLLFFSPIHAQDKAIEGIDIGFEQAMKYAVSQYDALWNPAVSASYSKGFAGYFQTVLFPPLNLPLKGYGIIEKEGKHSYQFFYDKFDASGELGFSWVEKKYRVGYGTQLNDNFFAGVNYKWMKTDVAWSGGSGNGSGKGWDAGLLYKVTHSAQIEFLYLDIDKVMRWSSGTTERLPSTKIIQGTLLKPLKNGLFKISSQGVFYDNKSFADDKNFQIGISYRFKRLGAVRVIFPDAGLYFLYGVSLRVGDLFVHYDVLDDKGNGLPGGGNLKYLSVTVGF